MDNTDTATLLFFNPHIFKNYAGALDALYIIIKAQHLELSLLRAVAPPALLPHPFITAPINGNDALTANLVLWTAVAMSSGIAGALNAKSQLELRTRGGDADSTHIQAIFGAAYDVNTYITRDFLIARLQFIHRALN